MKNLILLLKKIFSKESLRVFRKAWGVLLGGIVVTLILTFIAISSVNEYLKESFSLEADEIRTRITFRLKAHSQVLKNGAAFFESSDSITRQEWKLFIERSQINQDLPGIQGIGYSMIVHKNELHKHIDKVRSEGFSNYTIRPEGKRDIYSTIIYLEPFDWRNQRAFGYDMFSEPIRQKAMIFARDNGSPALSGKVILVQEIEEDIQAGTLMYVPVYQNPLEVKTIEERRNNIKGWVFSPYRMIDLMEGILGKSFIETDIELEVFDGNSTDYNNLLYSSITDEVKKTVFHKEHTKTITHEIYGSVWTLKFTKNASPLNSEHSDNIYFILFVGLVTNILVFALYFVMISNRLKAKELSELTDSLSVSEEKYRKFVENALVGVFRTTISGDILFTNDALIRMFEYETQDEFLREKAVFYYKNPERRKDFVNQLKQYGKVTGFEAEFVTKYGKVVSLMLNCVLTENQIDGTIIDITDRINAQRELELKSDELQKTISEKDKFFSIIAHDLKSPFQGFIGITQMMAENTNDFSINELSMFSQEMNKRAKNLLKFLKNLLDWARVQQGVIQFEKENILVKELVLSDIETVKPMALNKEITIEYNIDETHSIIADANSLHSVIQNLLSNAIKFSHRGGKIDIVSQITNNNLIEISIKDFGVGMNEETLSKLFKIEERVGEIGTEGEESTGLGLLLCKEFVEKNGGTISVQSEIDKGSTFTIKLPSAK